MIPTLFLRCLFGFLHIILSYVNTKVGYKNLCAKPVTCFLKHVYVREEQTAESLSRKGCCTCTNVDVPEEQTVENTGKMRCCTLNNADGLQKQFVGNIDKRDWNILFGMLHTMYNQLKCLTMTVSLFS